jgi:hypothetical protein
MEQFLTTNHSIIIAAASVLSLAIGIGLIGLFWLNNADKNIIYFRMKELIKLSDKTLLSFYNDGYRGFETSSESDKRKFDFCYREIYSIGVADAFLKATISDEMAIEKLRDYLYGKYFKKNIHK